LPWGWGTATTSLFDYTPETLAPFLQERGEPSYRARQVLAWAYRGAPAYEVMSNLPATLRSRLTEALPLWSITARKQETSADGATVKVVFRLPDGPLIEAVNMRHEAPSDAGTGPREPPSTGPREHRTRTTICVSSQAGCAYGCRFCATGQQGYGRNLSAGEIVQQVIWWLRPGLQAGMPALASAHRVTNVVFMGMGEPFANYEATRDALWALNAPWGLGLGARHITVSTVGLAPEIRRFAAEPLQVGLAVSLHAANDDLRSSLLPVNRKYPLGVLMPACRDYVAKTNRRITFEYVLLGGVNDSRYHARELGALLRGLLAHVNVIPVNPTDGGAFTRPEESQVRAFVQEVQRSGVPVTLRDTQGVEIQAGCGQLRARETGRAPVLGSVR